MVSIKYFRFFFEIVAAPPQMTFSQMAAVQNTFPNEKSVVMRERQAKCGPLCAVSEG